MGVRAGTTRSVGAAATVLIVLGCAGRTRDSLYPIPEHTAATTEVRGSEAAARALSDDQQIRIISEVVRRFYRPMGGQARWIDARPLAHSRTFAADNVSKPEEDWADAIVQAVALRRVCATDSDAACRDRPGGVLRFSRPYGSGPDSAVVFARYTPAQFGAEGEMEFRMVRRDAVWHIASKRTVVVGSLSPTPQHLVADELLTADRAFSAASARTDVISALSALFDANVIMPVPGNAFAEGEASALEALRTNADNARSRLEWTPIRAGVSADGQQGFTFGYMTLHRPDSSRVPMKYMAYWIKRAEGWRVIGYKRRQRPASEVSVALMPPSLPGRSQPPTTDAAAIARHRESLADAEREFSDTAQVIGVGPAFAKYGLADAVNMGGQNDTMFVVGAPAIARSVGAGYPPAGSPVSWAADYKAIVASSGDLGITFGFIRPNAPAAGQPAAAFPFFTIWKRASPTDPWRYIAE